MTSLFLLQLLNGVQLGVLLFLIAAGLTLVFGIMDFVNLAHGVIYMVGAYLVVMFAGLTGSGCVAAAGCLLVFFRRGPRKAVALPTPDITQTAP